MKYLNPRWGKGNILNANYSDVRNPQKKKSKLWKWIKRIAFFIFLFILFLEFNHFAMAIDALQHVNADQANIINDLAHKVHDLQTSNVDLQSQAETLRLKINGIYLDNMQNQAIHNEVQNAVSNIQPQTDLHMNDIQTKIHNDLSSVTPMAAVTTTTIAAVSILLKGIHAFVPVLP